MANKTAELKFMVTPETKARLRAKSQELGLSMTAFIEKVAVEEIVFIDKNYRRGMMALNLKIE